MEVAEMPGRRVRYVYFELGRVDVSIGNGCKVAFATTTSELLKRRAITVD